MRSYREKEPGSEDGVLRALFNSLGIPLHYCGHCPRALVLHTVPGTRAYGNRTGQHASREIVEGIIKESHNSTKEIIGKAGEFKMHERSDGLPPAGSIPVDIKSKIKHNALSNDPMERAKAFQEIADMLPDEF